MRDEGAPCVVIGARFARPFHRRYAAVLLPVNGGGKHGKL
jgi:hypothetical protein